MSFFPVNIFAIVLVGLLTASCQSTQNKEGKTEEHVARIQVHGHRGSRGTHPENTLPAFQEAVAAAADFLEFDLQLSQDGTPIVAHDPIISGKLCKDAKGKLVRKPIALNKLTVAKIQSYDCGSVPQDRFPEQKQVPGTRISTFEEVLQWWSKDAPKIGLNVELKMDARPTPNPDKFAKSVVDLLKKYNAVSVTFLQSFDFTALEAVKKIEPAIAMSCLFEDKEKDLLARTEKAGCKFISPAQNLVTAALVKEAHGKGIKVVPWTANKPEEWKRLADAGVDAIITDYPRKLVEFLAKAPATYASTTFSR